MPYEIGADDDEVGYWEIGSDADILLGDYMVGEAYGQERFKMGALPRSQSTALVPSRSAVINPYRRTPPQPAAKGVVQMSPEQAYQLQSRQSLIREREPTKSRQFVIGFDSVSTVAAAGSSNLTAQPQVLFRPERLVVAGSIASSFVITDFKVGKNSQLVASGNVPADAFAPGAFGVRLKCDTAQVSATITLSVTNISGGALRFLAALFGEAVE